MRQLPIILLIVNILATDAPYKLRIINMMTVKDLEKVQKTFKEAGQDYQVELESGKIIILGPSDIVSSEIGVIFRWLLAN